MWAGSPHGPSGRGPAGGSPDKHYCPEVLVLRGGDPDPRLTPFAQPGPRHYHRSCPCRLIWAAQSVQTCPCVSLHGPCRMVGPHLVAMKTKDPAQPHPSVAPCRSEQAIRLLGQRGHQGSRRGGGVQQRVQVPLGPPGSCPKAQSMPTVSPPKVPAPVTALATAAPRRRPLLPSPVHRASP